MMFDGIRSSCDKRRSTSLRKDGSETAGGVYVAGSCGMVWEHAGGAFVVAGGGAAETVVDTVADTVNRGLAAGEACGVSLFLKKPKSMTLASITQANIYERRFIQSNDQPIYHFPRLNPHKPFGNQRTFGPNPSCLVSNK